MHAYLAEFIGTALLILLGNGVVANVVLPQTKGHASGWIVISFGWAMAVFVAVWCTAAASGAHLNPAVTIGLVAANKFASAKAIPYIIAQLAGAIVGATLVYLFYRDHYAVSDDPGARGCVGRMVSVAGAVVVFSDAVNNVSIGVTSCSAPMGPPDVLVTVAVCAGGSG